MKARSVREYAVSQVRGAHNALRGAQLVFESLLQMAADGRVDGLAARVGERQAALRMDPADGATARGGLAELLMRGPANLEELAIINCYFAVGVVDRLAKLPKENRRSYSLEVVRRADFLLTNTSYSPYEFLVEVAPAEVTTQIWDALVQSLIDEVNRGSDATDRLLIRAEALRPLPAQTRMVYTRKILSECHEPEAALRYGALLASLDIAQPDVLSTEIQVHNPAPRAALSAAAPPGANAISIAGAPVRAAVRATAGGAPRALLPPASPKAIAAPRRVAALPPGPAAPLAIGAPPPVSLLSAAIALRGQIVVGPSCVFLRAVLLLSGLSLLRDVGLFLGRLVGLHRDRQLTVAGEELVAEESTRLLGRVLGHRRRSYPMPAVATIVRDVPYHRLYLLLGLAGATLGTALIWPLVWPPESDALRLGPLYAVCVVMLGVAFELVRFVRLYLRRGHCAITVGVSGGDVYHLGAVSEASLRDFVEHIHSRGGRGQTREPGPRPPQSAPSRDLSRRLES